MSKSNQKVFLPLIIGLLGLVFALTASARVQTTWPEHLSGYTANEQSHIARVIPADFPAMNAYRFLHAENNASDTVQLYYAAEKPARAENCVDNDVYWLQLYFHNGRLLSVNPVVYRACAQAR